MPLRKVHTSGIGDNEHMTEIKLNAEPSDAQKFDTVVRKILSVSHEELKKREKAWKRNKARRKKRAKTSPASHASNDKD
jgi:hypothetical protein